MKLKVFVKIGRKYEILSWNGEELIVGVNAAPVDGAANIKLVKILSDWLGISKNKITVVKGHTSRHKTLDADIDIKLFNSLITKLK